MSITNMAEEYDIVTLMRDLREAYIKAAPLFNTFGESCAEAARELKAAVDYWFEQQSEN